MTEEPIAAVDEKAAENPIKPEEANNAESQEPKRSLDEVDTDTKPEGGQGADEGESISKKPKMEDPKVENNQAEEDGEDDGEGPSEGLLKDDDSGPAPIPASTEGTSFFSDHDVLSGRGGGTNVHPGNRNFRDLINMHRRAYLKARKNDKPAISRAIVRSIREKNGRFLKKDDKSGLWFEIGDDAAREKTSQALRQRAPEMRKLLFDTEREEARAAAEEHLRQQRMLMGMAGPEAMGPGGMQMPMPMGPGGPPMFPNPALLAMANKNGMGMPNGQDPYTQMFSAALLGGNMPRFPPNGTGHS